MTWLDGLDWTEVMLNIDEWVKVAVFRVVVKAEPEFKSVVDKGASLSATNKCAKSSLPAMARLEYVRKRNSRVGCFSSFRVPLRGKDKTTKQGNTDSPWPFTPGTNQPFTLSTRLSHSGKWTVEGAGEKKESTRGRNDSAELVESREGAQGRGDPHRWVPVSVSLPPPTPPPIRQLREREGVGGGGVTIQTMDAVVEH